MYITRTLIQAPRNKREHVEALMKYALDFPASSPALNPKHSTLLCDEGERDGGEVKERERTEEN